MIRLIMLIALTVVTLNATVPSYDNVTRLYTAMDNALYNEIGNMDNNYSFIYNAVNLILRDAPLYHSFLPDSAVSVLKRAEFYRLLTTGVKED